MSSKKRIRGYRLLRKRIEKEFFQNVHIPGTYRYDSGDYLFPDVQRIATKYGLNIKYNNPDTVAYKYYGAFNFSVLSIVEPEEVPIEVLIFDVKELAI